MDNWLLFVSPGLGSCGDEPITAADIVWLELTNFNDTGDTMVIFKNNNLHAIAPLIEKYALVLKHNSINKAFKKVVKVDSDVIFIGGLLSVKRGS